MRVLASERARRGQGLGGGAGARAGPGGGGGVELALRGGGHVVGLTPGLGGTRATSRAQRRGARNGRAGAGGRARAAPGVTRQQV